MRKKEHLRPRRTSRLWGAVLATCVCVSLFFFWLVESDLAKKRMGLVLDDEEQVIRVLDVSPGLPAEQAGIEADDIVQEIRGMKVHDLSTFDVSLKGWEQGDSIEFLVQRNQESHQLSVFPGVSFPWPVFLACGIAALLFLALGLMALQSPMQSLRTRLLTYLCAAVALELSLPPPFTGGYYTSFILGIVFTILSSLQMALELHLVSLIPVRHRWVRKLPALVPGFYIAGFLQATLYIATEVSEVFNLGSMPWNQSQFTWWADYIVLPLWGLALVILLVSQVLQQRPSKLRHQAGLVLAGTLPWSILVCWLLVLEVLGLSSPTWSALGLPLTSAFLPIAYFFAMFRYKLFENDLVIRRQLVYNLMTANLVLLGYLALGMLGIFLTDSLDDSSSSMWIVSFAALLMGASFRPLKGYLKEAVERRLFPERSLLRHRLTVLADEVARQKTVTDMSKMLTKDLPDILGARSSTLLLMDPATGLLFTYASSQPAIESDVEHSLFLSNEDAGIQRLLHEMAPLPVATLAPLSASFSQRIEPLHADLAIPLLRRGELSGLLLLGEKETGEAFPPEELDLLTLLAHHVASSLENVQLVETATLEELTGLMRREAILECVRKELRRSLRYSRSLSVAMIDLDHFKAVNDRFGHIAGDQILKDMAELLSENIRSSDLLGRYGGEEFLLIMPETDLSAAVAVSNKLRKLAGAVVFEKENQEVQVTLSIGVSDLAQFQGKEAPTIWELIASADEKLYSAKRAGRNRVEPKESLQMSSAGA